MINPFTFVACLLTDAHKSLLIWINVCSEAQLPTSPTYSVYPSLRQTPLLCSASQCFGPVGGEEAIKKALVAWLHRAGRQTGRNINRRTQSTGRQTGTQSGNSGGQTDGEAGCTHRRWQRWQVDVFVYAWVERGQYEYMMGSICPQHIHTLTPCWQC